MLCAYQDCASFLIHLPVHTLTAVFQSHDFLKRVSLSLQCLSVDRNEQTGGEEKKMKRRKRERNKKLDNYGLCLLGVFLVCVFVFCIGVFLRFIFLPPPGFSQMCYN